MEKVDKTMSQKKYIGLDIGSVSIKAVLINERKEILEFYLCLIFSSQKTAAS